MRIPDSTGASIPLSASGSLPLAVRRYRLSQIFQTEFFEASLSVLREAIGVLAKPPQGLPDQEDL